MAMVKSPLRYPGGKSKALRFLEKFIPEFKEFREPMCGGASMTLYLAQKRPSARFIMGDINYDLFCFWKELKERPGKLIEEIKLVKKNFREGRKLFEELLTRRTLNLDCFQRAVDFFVLNRITFSGTVDCGGYSEEAFKKRFTESSIERLWTVSNVLQRVELYHGDYEHLLNLPGNEVFIFLDPPYYSATASKLYGRKGSLHTGFDHERLASLVKECPHKLMVTYDNSQYIRNLYRGFYMVEWRLKYGMTNYGRNYLREGDELLIANYSLKESFKALQKQASLFQKVAKYYSS
ncbi:MAG: DNA adenine methylase [candidate division WOR-3 bacterium]|nr:DNA adenine methylase [candidate division WOR-3 bacterium]MDW8151244.1 DNA adenine methylase [candidate division WOR-3 bacterium]